MSGTETIPLTGATRELNASIVLSGRLYWHGIYPLRALVFRGMSGGIAARGLSNA